MLEKLSSVAMAKQAYSELLSRKMIRSTIYGMSNINLLSVTSFHPSDREYSGGNIEFDIEYLKHDLTSTGYNNPTPELSSSFSLLFLTNEGDSGWDEVFRLKLFKGRPPMSLALDTRKGHLYLVFDTEDSLEISLFCEIPMDEVEQLLESLRFEKPYSLELEPRTLMKLITQEEGYGYARQMLKVKFNTTLEQTYVSHLLA